jgi:putative endonuclease
MPKKSKQWVVYILKCFDETLYTGITNDLDKRVVAHDNGTGAKYTKGRGPVEVIKIFEVENRSEASKLECKIKKMRREDKLKL